MRKSKIINVLPILAMFCLIIAILFTSFQIAIYGDVEYRFYEKEYRKHEVTEALDMEMADVMEVTDHMMAYLIGEEEELSIVTTVEGKEQDFFNEQDRLHMADVKHLFLGGLKLRWGLLGIFLLLIALFVARKGDWKKQIPRAYFLGLGIFGVVTAVLGGMFASDFTKYFTIFHEIFFTNDLWIFDPETDYMIRMLPEGFFYDMLMRIGAVFIGILVLLLVGAFVWKRLFRIKDIDKDN